MRYSDDENHKLKTLQMILNYNDVIIQIFDQLAQDAAMLSVESEGKHVIPTQEYLDHVHKVKTAVLEQLSNLADI